MSLGCEQCGHAPNLLQVGDTTELLLTDIGLELFGLALMSMDGREVYARRRE